jgi:hypothetical protein
MVMAEVGLAGASTRVCWQNRYWPTHLLTQLLRIRLRPICLLVTASLIHRYQLSVRRLTQ